MSTLACQACGAVVAPDARAPYKCPNAGTDDGDHLLVRTLDASARFACTGEGNPFVRWRELSLAHEVALAHGMSDADYVSLVTALDARVAAAWGTGFVITPFSRAPVLSSALGFSERGGVWVKNETRNVSGSHKARHLFGIALHGEVLTRVGVTPDRGARLAIASCGNAALAAAVVARAWARPLDVFIPDDAHPRVVAELGRLGATVHVCVRDPLIPGDPCYVAFKAAVAGGALPFCCQGPDNGLTIEGGETLAWEIVAALHDEGGAVDRLFVQVGGGALASACVQGFADAARAGVSVRLPRIHPVQTRGAFPLRRAWETLVARIATRLGLDAHAGDVALAEAIRVAYPTAPVQEELAWATAHRATFMWPWETAPHSIAHGILDDETYDWLAILRGTLASGGTPLVVTEEQLHEAHRLGRETTGIDVDPTGASGLAGVLALSSQHTLSPDESVAVLFTGVTR